MNDLFDLFGFSKPQPIQNQYWGGQQANAMLYNRMMSLDAHYSRKGWHFIGITSDPHAGREWITVQRPTTIPKVSR